MLRKPDKRIYRPILAVAIGLLVANCGSIGGRRLSSQECLARAMYFESNRSSDDGMLAVGTVVMNRYESGKYGKSICAVVGAPRQFAPGVLSRSMSEPKSRARAMSMARQVLKGRRHEGVGKAQFFHTAGYNAQYSNMRYVSIEGGNAFYEKEKAGTSKSPLTRIARGGARSINDLLAIDAYSVPANGPAPELNSQVLFQQNIASLPQR